MIELVLLILILVGIWVLRSYYNTRQYWTRQNVKQPFVWPIFGENWRFLFRTTSFDEYFKDLDQMFSNERYYGIHQAKPTLVIRDPDLIKQLGVKDFDHFLDRNAFTSKLPGDELANRNLFALKGQPWKEMRATLSPSFTSSKMKAMFTLMKQSGEQYVDFYQKQKKDIVELEVKDSFTRFTNDVIANCAFGIGCDSLNEPNNEFYLNGKELSNFQGTWRMIKLIARTFFPKISLFLGFTTFAPHLSDYFKTLVRDSMKHREKHNIVRPDMINLLMEAKKGLLKYEENSGNSKSTGFATVEESHVGQTETRKVIELTESDMAAQVAIFFLAGFDTVSSMMTFMCYALATNPDIQKKLRDEVDETFKATQGNLTYDGLTEMKYMDMVITESLRKHPPLYFIDRECTKSYVIEPKREGESPVLINQGDLIWFPVYAIHHDPENYPEPDNFIPERFSEENKFNIKPYTYLPFGVGPRNCIGSRFALMEIKTLFYNILLKYEIVPTAKTIIPLELDKSSLSPTVKGGCWVGFKQRRTKID